MINKLESLGLTLYESRIVELLSKEKLNLRELSKKSKVPFGKIYSVVKNLKEKGIVFETNTCPKLVYVENFSEVVGNLIKKKIEMQKNIFEELKEFATISDSKKGNQLKFFDIGTTVQDNKRIQLRTFLEAEKEVLQILNIHHKPKSNRESKTIWEKEIVNAINRGVNFKAIYPKETILPLVLQKLIRKDSNKFQVKRINTDFVRCDIIDEKKVLIKLVHQDPLLFGGVLFIENERLAENLKRFFMNLWNSE